MPTVHEARHWLDRWDRQQEFYMADREERFAVIADVVEAVCGPEPLIVDLGVGPGSLSVRLLDRLPGARVVGVDADPLLLGLARIAYGDRIGLRLVDHDLRLPGWLQALNLDRAPDAIVSTTALHWLTADALAAVYAEVATVLRPGGLLLDGDHLTEDQATAPTLARLGRALIEREEQRRPPAAGTDTWAGWWEAARADPALAGLAERRDRMHLETEHHGSPAGRLAVHVEALRQAGFAEVGTLWQRGDNRVLCAVLPAAA